MIISFAALARYHCMAHIGISDLLFTVDGVKLTFWNSKTDTFNQGQSVHLPPVAGSYACPVEFLKA